MALTDVECYMQLQEAIMKGKLLPNERLITGRPERSFQEHHAIVEAVTGHDPDRAEAAMKRHLSQVAEALRSFRETCSPGERENS